MIARNDRNRFHFYFGDSLELCLKDKKWKNNFHVIHCPADYSDFAQLTNILPVVSQCLNADFPEAVLVTELTKVKSQHKVESFVKTVESQKTTMKEPQPSTHTHFLKENEVLNEFLIAIEDQQLPHINRVTNIVKGITGTAFHSLSFNSNKRNLDKSLAEVHRSSSVFYRDTQHILS